MRLARLLAVRRVRLQAAARQLGAAARTVAQLEALQARLRGLRGELGIDESDLDGYTAKAVTAARATLATAGDRQAARLIGATQTRAQASDLTRQRRVASDVVEQALAAQPLAGQAATPSADAAAPATARRPRR